MISSDLSTDERHRGDVSASRPVAPMYCLLETGADKREVSFRADSTKKSVYWLDTETRCNDGGDRRNPNEKCEDEHNRNTLPYLELADPSMSFSTISGSLYRPDGNVFYLGGFQILSTSKTVEVYLQSPQQPSLQSKASPAEEINSPDFVTYLTTSRGIPVQPTTSLQNSRLERDTVSKDSFPNCRTTWYKTMCVIPGGPRPVTRAVLKFHIVPTSQPPSEKDNIVPAFCLQSMKLTCRIPDDTKALPSTNSINTAMHQPSSAFLASPEPVSLPATPSATLFSSTTSTSESNGSTGVSADDVGAAMAGISFLVRSAEERLLSAVQHGQHETQQYIRSNLPNMLGSAVEAAVSPFTESQQSFATQQAQLFQAQHKQLESQQTMLLHQTRLLESQQRQLAEQSEQLQRLETSQALLLAIVASLRTQREQNQENARAELDGPSSPQAVVQAIPSAGDGTRTKQSEQCYENSRESEHVAQQSPLEDKQYS